MRTAILKRLDALEASLGEKARKPIMLLDVDDFDPADRDAYLDGDDSVLTRYGFDPDDPSPGVRAIIIGVHPERRNEWDDLRDLDDEEFERLERQREADERRRQAVERERAQLAAIEAANAEQLPPAPGNAYSPLHDRG